MKGKGKHMKQKHIVLLLVAASIVFLFLTSCDNTANIVLNTTPAVNATGTSSAQVDPQTETLSTTGNNLLESENFKLQFQQIGTYNIRDFGSEFTIYRFDGTDAVVYEIFPSIFFIGEDAGKTGASYSNCLYKIGDLLAISNHYWLFFTEENGKVAVSFHGINGGYLLPTYPFDDLSAEEQSEFLYVSATETITN